MNSRLGVNEVLEILDRLRGVLRTFAGREEKLEAEFRARSDNRMKSMEVSLGKLSTRLSEEIARANTAFQAEKDRCQSRFDQRKIRIHQAHRSSQRQALEHIEKWEGCRKYQVQKGVMENERRREVGVAAAAAKLAEFNQKLETQHEEHIRLEISAQKAFRGYHQFRRLLSHTRPWSDHERAADEYRLLDELLHLNAKIRDELDHFKKTFLPRLFGRISIWPLIVLLSLGHAALIPILHHFGITMFVYRDAGLSLILVLAVVSVARFFGRRQANPAIVSVATDLAQARRLLDACWDKAQKSHRLEQERVESEFARTKQTLDQQWRETVQKAEQTRQVRPRQIGEKQFRASQTNEQQYRARLAQLEGHHADMVARLQQEAEAEQAHIKAEHEATLAKIDADHQSRWLALEKEWKSRVNPLWETIRATNAAEDFFPDWHLPRWEKWSPPSEFGNAVRFARLEVDIEKFAEVPLLNRPLALPCPASFSVPLFLAYPRQGSILFETTQTGSEEVAGTINNIIYRLLSTTPPGRVNITLIDPVGLGQNFAGLMHLADDAPGYINGRIWTQTPQIEEKLAELNEHMEKVIQMYLRNEFETIVEYNAQAGSIVEKYYLLVIAGFPVNFSETAARRLINIATSGARCGVYTLIHWDQRHTLPQDFVPDELRRNSISIVAAESGLALSGRHLPGTRLVLDPPPPPEVATRFLHAVGQSSKDSNRVEVPFAQVAPPESRVWTMDTTDNEADAYLIMDENNAAPRLLSRPGEGIYNDGAGVLEANSPFQVVWLSDEERDGLLAKIRDRADQNLKASFTPFIFEGNAPAEVRENALLCAALETEPSQAPVSPRIWLGAPNAVKGPTEAVFHRQSGNNLLIVGLREDAVLAILAVALVSLAAQYPRESVRFTLFDSTPPGSRQREFLDRVIQAIPHAILRPKPGDLAAILNGLADELKQRTHQGPATEAPTNFLIIHALENFKKLRVEDDYNFSLGNSESDIPCSTLLARLINEGPNYGLHVIATCDICSNAIRFLGRKTLSEIAMRVLFQMSANDSATLIDSTHASSLGLHRALFYNDQEGILEAFRPYALPDNEWLEQVARKLVR